jgi:DNA-directed RNA polymerase specialized sigma24 family protein
MLFAWAWERSIAGWVALTVAPEHCEEVVRRALTRVCEAVCANPPEAVNERQLRGWMKKIVRNDIADWYRGPAGRTGRGGVPLLGDGDDDDAPAGARPGEEDAGYDAVSVRDVIARALADEEPLHARVWSLRREDRYTSKEIAEIIERETGDRLSTANIDQIVSRVGRRVRRALEDEGMTP